MVAKKKQILTQLVSDFRTNPPPSSRHLPPIKGEEKKSVEKTYYAIVLGRLSRNSWTITKKLLRIEGVKKENKIQVSDKWQTAITHYKKLAEYCIENNHGKIYLTELEVVIETGRMHQIRVHMATLWNPIVWDDTYGDKKLNAFFKRNYGLTRQALHAWKISFFHGWRDQQMQLEASIKDDLKNFIIQIKK